MEQSDRWVEVTPSQFSHEAEGLRRVRDALPDHAPYRAWSNFEFRDGHGKWHEVDLLVLGRRRLHLVELKYYSGTLRGDDHRWLRDGHRAEDSPLKLARRKAQRLASRLQDELRAWARETGNVVPDVRDVIPFVQESVFLHHPGFQAAMSPQASIDLYGIDDAGATSNLPGISQRLLEPPDLTNSRYQVGSNRDVIIAKLLERIGVVQRRQREAGSWVIDEEPLDDGDGWQDWPAFHRVAKDDLARVRFFLTPPGASAADQQRVRRLADHEYGVTKRLQHEGLLRPVDMVDADLGIGVVYPVDRRFQRLDLWLSDQQALGGRGVSVGQQLTLVRQVAEALGYAHGNRVVHRGLTPHAVSVAEVAGALRVLVGEWQSAGAVDRPAGEAASRVLDGVTDLHGAASEASRSSDRTGRAPRAPRRTDDQLRGEVFQAPEGVFTQQRASVDRVRLDVFALGALAYYVFSGRPPASDRSGLQERLRRDDGLDLAADVPQVPSAVREVVLRATRPTVGERTPDVRTFLEGLSLAERATGTTVDLVLDPLEAPPGTVLDGRWLLERRLGAGSTAVGLLVTDLTAPVNQGRRVLKVALHDAAATRLAGEAEVLAGLDHPRLVRLVDGPVDVGERRALVLESAGDSTLSDELRGRTRTSIDLLERWGTDLLEALVALDAAGTDHRDIKPSNLGVRENRGDRVRHLVLFDFSLSRAGASAVTAGTPPYLDPFLGDRERGSYDSAAERYSASVVLFEMATGATPVFGDDPASDPASITAAATLDPRAFDPTLSGGLIAFFRRSLARRAGDRHHTAAQMLAEWRALFAPATTQVDDGEQRAATATPTTPLAGAGLSARALSALEPYGVATVGDLLAVDAAKLTRMSGVAVHTRQEVKDRAGQWRTRLGAAAIPGAPADASPDDGDDGPDGAAPRLDVAEAAAVLAAGVGGPRAKKPRAAARLLLGLDGALAAFASQSAVASALGLRRAEAIKQREAIDRNWERDEPSVAVLETVAHLVLDVLDRSRGVVTVDELTAAVFEVFDHPRPTAREVDDERIARGLLWLGIDRLQALASREDDGPEGDSEADGWVVPLSLRRRDGLTSLVATAPALLDAADTLGRAADALVDQAVDAGEPLVPRERATARLREAVETVLDVDDPLVRDGARVLRLAAETATRAVLSGSDELHDRGLDPAEAVRLALGGMEAEASDRITAHEIVSRVRARFPALPPIPGRPRLDDLVEAARLDLVFEPRGGGGYRSRGRVADTTGLESHAATTVALPSITSISHGHISARLAESISARSFLALGVAARRIDRTAELLRARHGVRTVDVTAVLIAALKDAAAAAGVPWHAVQAADAEAPGTRGAQGLGVLVAAALPAVDAAIESAADQAPEGSTAVVLLDAAPLARYGHLSRLSRWTDLAVRRRQAVWVVVPQLGGNRGALLDGSPLPLAAPGQFLRVDESWFAGPSPTAPTAPIPTGATA